MTLAVCLFLSFALWKMPHGILRITRRSQRVISFAWVELKGRRLTQTITINCKKNRLPWRSKLSLPNSSWNCVQKHNTRWQSFRRLSKITATQFPEYFITKVTSEINLCQTRPPSQTIPPHSTYLDPTHVLLFISEMARIKMFRHLRFGVLGNISRKT